MTVSLVLAGCAGTADDTSSTGSTDGSRSATVDVDGADGTVVTTATGEAGLFLTDADGMTLYLFTNDSHGVSTCSGDCLIAWPALLTDAGPVAGAGVDAALLGTTARDDGSTQVTYAGWPLYRFAGDVAPGDTTGQGVNEVWFVLSPTGQRIAPATEAPSEPTMGGPYSSEY
jgi:predicted lipoprotein with Yx(FWY)xxD motif